jgi:hypothetical protein
LTIPADAPSSSTPFDPQPKEALVPSKSPQKPSGKKPGKSLKEKRVAKREKKAGKTALGR